MKDLFLKITAMSFASFAGSYIGTQKWFDKHDKCDKK
jgi:hypothetical protein